MLWAGVVLALSVSPHGVAGSPSFSLQPVGTAVTEGATVTLSAGVADVAVAEYRWFKDGVPVRTTSAGSLVLPRTRITDSGSYTVTAVSSAGSVTSRPAAVVVSRDTGALPVAAASSDGSGTVTYPIFDFTTIAGRTSFGSSDGVGSAARFNGPGGIAVDGSGNLYVADGDNAVIRKVTPGGVVTTVAGAVGERWWADGTGANARFSSPTAVAVDGNGVLYVTDSGSTVIRKITAGGVVTTLAGLAYALGTADGTGSSARFFSPQGIAVDAAGSTIVVLDGVQNTVRRVTAAGVVSTLAGVAGQSGATDGTGSQARFNSPQGVALGSDGMIYVADMNNSLIRKITPAGVVTTLAGAVGQVGNVDGFGATARFYYPQGVAVDRAQNVYVADPNNRTVRKISPTATVTTLTGVVEVQGLVDGPAGTARLAGPRGIAASASGTVYLVEANTVRMVTPAGAVSTMAGQAFGNADGASLDATFYNPGAVAIDANLNLYVADTGNHSIRKIFRTSGQVTTLAGQPGIAGFADGTGAAAKFNSPFAVTMFLNSDLFVADRTNMVIRRVSPVGATSLYAGMPGVVGASDGVAGGASFYFPEGVATDSAGVLYVADANNKVIRKISTAGVVSTLAGAVGLSGIDDGVGSAARFTDPRSVAIGPEGEIYVADAYTIRKITTAGVVTTFAGVAGQYGFADGAGAAARFGETNSVACSGGELFVCDARNHTLRKISYAGVVTTIGGSPGTSGSTDGVGAAARFSSPLGMAIQAGTPNFWVADTGNHTIRLGRAHYLPTIVLRGIPRGLARLGSEDSMGFSAYSSYGSYGQWIHNGRPMIGSTEYFIFNPVTERDAGWYQAVASDGPAVARSEPFFLSVVVNPAQVVPWGNNFYGQNTVPPGLTSIVDVRVGDAHTLALKGDGTLAEWGSNTLGGIGIPAGLSNIAAISVASNHNLALTFGGKVVAWGGQLGAATVPAGLSSVVAIAAGANHNLALKSDGTVVAWGSNDYGQISVPAGLTGVTGIAAAFAHSLAVKSDGTVVAWGGVGYDYGQVTVPSGLANVIEVAAGLQHSVALKSDGSVVAWGSNAVGQTAVPAGLANVVAISTSHTHTIATRADRTVVAWGSNASGESVVPVGMNNVIRATAGYLKSVVVRDASNDPVPVISTQPVSVLVANGQSATFSVTASVTGANPLTYQWRRGGFAIPGATGAAFTLPTPRRSDVDSYDVIVSAGGASVSSNPALLSVAPTQTINYLVPDLTFAPRFESSDLGAINAWLPLSNGKYLVGGNFTGIGGATRSYLARISSNGVVDTTYLPPALNGEVLTLARQGDGRILVGGLFSSVDGRQTGQLLRLNSDLTIDGTFSVGQGFDAQFPSFTFSLGGVRTLATQSDGRILVGGNFARFQGVNRASLVRLMGDGSLDSSFSAAAAINSGTELVRGVVRTILVQADGRIVVGGTFSKKLARLNGDGSLDTTFDANLGTGFGGHVYVARAATGGRLWVAGEFTTLDGVARNRVVRLNNNGAVDPTFVAPAALGGFVFQLEELPTGHVLLGGDVLKPTRLESNGAPADTLLFPFDAFQSTVALQVSADGSVFVGVSRVQSGSAASGTLPAFYNMTVGSAVSALIGVDARALGTVNQVALAGNGIYYAAGNFTHVNGVARQGVVRLATSGAVDATFDAGAIGAVTRLALQGDGRVVVQSGVLQRLNADGTADASFAVTSNSINSLLGLDLRGRAMVSQYLSSSNSWLVKRLTTAGQDDATFSWPIFTGGPVQTVGFAADEKVLIGGSSGTVNGESFSGVVRLNPDGTRDTGFVLTAPTGLNAGTTRAFALIPDGRFYSGRDGVASGLSTLQRFNANGTVDTGFDTFFGGQRSPNNMPTTLGVVVLLDGRIIRGGGDGFSGGPAFSRHLFSGARDPSFLSSTPSDLTVKSFLLLDDGRVLAATSRGAEIFAAGAVPAVTTPPSSVTTSVGGNATFAVAATGGGLSYQWSLNDTPIPGATSATLILRNVSASDSGNYTVAISNLLGTVTAGPVALALAPAVVTPFASRAVGVGGLTVFRVGATGSPPLSYQWRKGGTDLPDATNSTYSIAEVEPSHAGTYSVRISNATATLVAGPAELIVLPNPLSYSARQMVSSAGVSAFFTIEGTVAKAVVLRALGPALGALGLAGGISDPVITVYDANGGVVASNDDWGAATGGDLSAIFAQVGASPLVAGSKDAAVYASLPPGGYRVKVSGAGGVAGLAVLELFDADRNSAGRLGYVSLRSTVATPGGSAFGGLTITNSANKRILIRAVGPMLGAGLGLANPDIRVRDRVSAVVASNDDWGGAPALVTATAAANAFPLPSGSADAAVLLDSRIGSGAYTVESTMPGATGDVLLEFYDLTPLTGAGIKRPLVVVPPRSQTLTIGGNVTLGALAVGEGPLSYQWRKNGVPIGNATGAQLPFAFLQDTHAGAYDVVVQNNSGIATSAAATLNVIPVGYIANHDTGGTGYRAGATVTITNTLTFPSEASALSWSVVLPAGWSYVADGGSAGEVKPHTGDRGTIGWAWTNPMVSPVTFTYTLSVPAGEIGPRTLEAEALVRSTNGNATRFAVTPGPLTIASAPTHSADTSRDSRIDLVELTRVIELYNTRNGTSRTGAYAVATAATEDGFAAAPGRDPAAAVSLERYHSADTQGATTGSAPDGRIGLIELTRVIQLYNYRNGTLRTGQYHVQSGTEDGFAPGP